MISRRMFFASPAAAALESARPGQMVPVPPVRRWLIVLISPQYPQCIVEALRDWLSHQGYEAVVIRRYRGDDGPDFRIYDLDGAPAPDTGILDEVKQLISQEQERYRHGS